MIKPFHQDWPLTQGFGQNPANYAKFGLKGHNGLDYGLPIGTDVIAPHAGKIIEAATDPTGYGNYLKIENDKEGSVLAHLQDWLVNVGDVVTEGQLIAHSDNTGNSTGSHLHWGYYLLPRDRQNGYAGFIDQLPLLTENISNTSSNDSGGTFVDKITFETLVNKATKYDAFVTAGYPSASDIIQIILDLKTAKENIWKLYQEENTHVVDLTSQIQTLSQEKFDLEGRKKELEQTNIGLKQNVSEVQARNASLSTHISEMEKADSTAIDHGVKAEADLKNALSDLNTIASALNTNYPDVKKVLIAVDDLHQQIADNHTIQSDQQKSFQKYLKVFIDFFIKHKVK